MNLDNNFYYDFIDSEFNPGIMEKFFFDVDDDASEFDPDSQIIEETDESGLEEDTGDEEGIGGISIKDYGKDTMSPDEVKLNNNYNLLLQIAKDDSGGRYNLGGRSGLFSSAVADALRTIIMSDPKNTSIATSESYTKALLGMQGHNRIPASTYIPDRPLRDTDLSEDFGGISSDDAAFNNEFTQAARDHIAEFIRYITTQDLSRDSVVSRRRKLRWPAAFLCLLICSNMYDLLINCPTLPDEYAREVNEVLTRIQEKKYGLVNELADKYEAAGRKEVGDLVRRCGLSWFLHEPAEILGLAKYAKYNLTIKDVQIYREIRPKYMNVSKTITQEMVSKYVKVVMEPGKVYEVLKDKTRAEAIADVKRVYKEWSIANPSSSELVDKIVFNS